MRFLLMLQYRAAAVAGFGTQCWWGLIKVMVLIAFFHSSARHQPLSLGQAVTYTWLGQAFLALLPWNGDPDIAEMVRTGNVSYDRLRPLDTYFYWYCRAVALLTARTLPRAMLMFIFATMVLPLAGLGDWRLRLPHSIDAAMLFLAAMVLVVLLASTVIMVINLVVVATISDRGVNALASPLVNVLSGNIVPLPFFPDWMQPFLFVQPFAGLVDIPYRIYFGNLSGNLAMAGLLHQIVWIVILALCGRALMSLVMGHLQVQGG
jgi:ABC-2 type transport system permease protein